MIALLLLCLQAQNLAAALQPQAAYPAAERTHWLVAALPGGPPTLYLLDGKEAHPVALPEDTLFVASRGDELTAVLPSQVRRFRWQQGRLVAQSRDQAIAPPLSRSHPWIALDWERVGASQFLAIFDRGRLVLVASDDRPVRQLATPDLAYDPFLNTRVFGAENGLHWSGDDRFFRVALAEPLQLSSLAAPPHGDMAEAFVVGFTGQQPVWLIHGGKRGSLDSFGWRIESAGGASSGPGIVTRFGVDRGAPRLKLVVMTVPNSIFGQAFRSFGSSRDFACEQVVFSAQGKPSRADRFKVAMSKGDRGDPYELSWDSDLNRDGYGDLVLADGRGLRLYLSGATGFWNPSPQKFGKVDSLLFLPDRLLAGHRTAKGWTFQERRLP